MSFSINMPNLDKVLREVANDGVKKLAARFQETLDDVHRTHAGRPVDEVRPVLAQRWAQVNDGASLTDPHLSQYAQAISDGQRIVMEPEQL